jgi:hypothetical protein
VAAALGELLVFDVEAGGAGALVFDDGAADHFGLAEAGVGIGDDGQAAGVGTPRGSQLAKWSRVRMPTSGTPADTLVAAPEM